MSTEQPTPTTYFQRFSLNQRIEHAILIVSFTILAATGLPQKYAGTGWGQVLIRLYGGIELTRQIHHIAAIVMMMETIYHVVSVGYRLYVRRVRLTMLPGLGDATEAIQTLLYNLGLRRQPPQAGRYTFGEKAEYWAVLWGTVIMVITGFMMWNPIATTRLVPGEFIPAAKSAHGGEALLAVLAIIIWHLYNVIVRHFNKSMFTGKLSQHEMLEEHPRELADLKAGVADRPVDPRQLQRRRQIYVPVAAVLALGLVFGVYRFSTFEDTALPTVIRGQTDPVFAPLTPTPFPTAPPTATAVQILPVWTGNIGVMLAQRCGACHGTSAGLNYATYELALKGSKNGPVIIPGDADNSPIVLKMGTNHPGKLNEYELGVLKAWIAAGAPKS
ncbi:MAG: cytochrome b/b6 domain-containing protein [Anaerolineales bacterium]